MTAVIQNNPGQPSSLLVFDFDGTLADSFSMIPDLIEKLATEFRFRRPDPEEIEAIRHSSWTQLRKKLEIPLYRVPSIVRRARVILGQSGEFNPPIPGIAAVLRNLHQRSYRLAVVTTNSVENVTHFWQLHEFPPLEVVLSAGMWNKGRQLKRLNRTKQQGPAPTYIGDETRDIKAARQAGFLSVAVTWGYHSGEMLRQHKPDHLIDKPAQLLDLFP